MQCLVSPETEFWKIPVFDVNDKHILVTGGSSSSACCSLTENSHDVVTDS